MRAALTVLVAGALGLAFLMPRPALSVLDADLREQVARSVVQVQARGCESGDRVGTGFAFGSEEYVVTALHVVADCGRITVYWEKHGGITSTATIARVLNGADLALLRIDSGPGQPLRAERRRPKTNDELEALGYYLAVPTMDNKPLRVTFGSSRLADMLPARVRRELAGAGSIDLGMEIVRLDGHLLPGLSGAPIVNKDGRVVAIGSGGLKSGAASVSWGVPAAHLEALLQSAEREIVSIQSLSLFATPLLENGNDSRDGRDQPEMVSFTCGGVRFVYTGMRTFEELTFGHGDLDTIEYLIDEAALTEADLAGFAYHTFQPVEGGAAVAVPEWAVVEYADTQHCQAVGMDRRISVTFTGQPVASFDQAQAVSVQFETDYAVWSERVWQPFPDYSYAGPLLRDDGLVVNRKAFLAIDPSGTTSLAAVSHLIHQPPHSEYANFTGVIGAAWNLSIDWYDYCDTAPSHPNCAAYQAEQRLVIQMVLGVYLSTAPMI
ncbi:MAG TPA: serine protease [Alphaproteobacteria bacterium]|nr:serine protease [Alphaproteobacteria bacterium]